MKTAMKKASEPRSDTGDNLLINDMVLKMATVNGSGSQSANLVLMRAIFRMGIPVSARNRFPSNIEGLPTWYTIRVNKNGWLGHRIETDILVEMNQKTAEEDLERLPSGTVVVLNESLRHALKRDDLDVHLVPFSSLVKDVCPDTKLRKKTVNMIYVGVVAWLIELDMDSVDEAIDHQFATKKHVAEMNRQAAHVGFDWAEQNLERKSRCRLEPSNQTDGQIIIEGNEATALGLLFGGVSVVAWYPITPSSSVCEALLHYLSQYRRDTKTGKATYAVVQAEDEIASIGVVLGAGWAGARACTATSGPGMSLMSEMAGLSYFAEVPAVIVNVQRMGPSTGLPTRTAQSDIIKAYHLSHGDCKHVLLIPGTVKECFEFGMEALDLADTLQTLVLVMSDLDLGMNKSVSDPFDMPTKPLTRGKVLTAEQVETMGGFKRYSDVDGDGIPYRTLPGTHTPKAAYFTRGTGHTPEAEYSEKAENWKENMDRLSKKFDTARDLVPRPIIEKSAHAKIGIIAYGSTDCAAREARHLLSELHGIESSYLRIRALPVNGEVRSFIEGHPVTYLVEQNRDAQMATILRGEYPQSASGLRSVLHYNGRAIDAKSVLDGILAQHSEGS